MAEGIPVDLVEFADNRPVLDMLLSRPLGLLALLDEESRFPRSNDRSLIEKFHNNVKSKFYQRPKSDAVCFAIHHFAGRVVYQADGFLEKNRNFLPAEIIQLIRQSQYDMIRFLFQCPITKTGNLYSAIQDTGSRQNVSNFIKVDTKVRWRSFLLDEFSHESHDPPRKSSTPADWHRSRGPSKRWPPTSGTR